MVILKTDPNVPNIKFNPWFVKKSAIGIPKVLGELIEISH